MHARQMTRAIATDISGAFDRVDRDRPLNVLEQKCGIRGKLLALLRSYFSDRFFRVVVGGHCSIPRPELAGVVQGSVSGPLYWLIFFIDCELAAQAASAESVSGGSLAALPMT